MSEAAKVFELLGADRKRYSSRIPGLLGGNGRMKIYGRLDCASAKRAVAKSTTYQKHRVFFADEPTAIAAGYRPCAKCMSQQYKAWRAEHPNK